MSVRDVPTLVDDTDASDELELRATPYTALYEHWERHQWSALAIDLTTDAATFQTLGETDREGLVWIFANRFHGSSTSPASLRPS